MSEYIYRREQVADGVFTAESTGEEIVRCRDCEYYDGEPDMESMGEKCWRDPNHSGRSMPTVPNGFCWRGERKHDER